MLAAGRSPAEARLEIQARSPEVARMLAVAAALSEKGDKAIPGPDPEFRSALAARLRADAPSNVRTLRPHRRPRFTLAPLAAAACIALFAALLVPAFRSLPGERLYGLKGLSEDARLVLATGTDEARVRVDLAEERFLEVERLIDRASVTALGTFAAASVLDGISDPRLAHLIETALQEAGRHLQAAADILTSQPSSASDLDELVEVSRRGHKLAIEVADDLPTAEHLPVLNTVVKLAKIEAEAKAARTKVAPDATPGLCAEPTPSPEPAPEGDGETGTESATPTAVESPTPSPTATPEATPCVSPRPTPTPEPTEEPADESTPEPTAAPEDEGDGSDGGDNQEVSGEGQTDQAHSADTTDA